MAFLYYQQEGHGPTVVLSHALGADLQMWDDVTNFLKDELTVIRYDHRNHGKSEKFATPFTINNMADDIASLIDEVSPGKPVFFVGLSMGGMVAQALASKNPNQVRAIVIANSAQYYDTEAKNNWNARIQSIESNGISSISDAILGRWFSDKFIENEQKKSNNLYEKFKTILENCDPKFYNLCCQAIANIDFRISNNLISCPTLVIAGTLDHATPPYLSHDIQRTIKNSEFIELSTAHLSAIEEPAIFANNIKNFFKALM